MNEQEMLDALNELRLLLFLECEGGGDCEELEEDGRHFHKVQLDEKQFKTVSDAIFKNNRKDSDLREGFEVGEVRLSGTFAAKPFDGLNSVDE